MVYQYQNIVILVIYDIQVKKALHQKSRIEPKESFKYCPYCGAPTTESFTGIELLNKLFRIYHKDHTKSYKYGKPKKAQLKEVPKSHHEPPKWLKELNDKELIEIESFAHLLRLNLLKTLFSSLGDLKWEYKVRSDRGNPKIVIKDFMRGEKYYIYKGIFNIGKYKKNVLIFSKDKDNIEINCISDINLIEEKTLKKDLALNKILKKGCIEGFRPGSNALVFEPDQYIIYIPVEPSFLEFEDENDINNFKEVSYRLAFKQNPVTPLVREIKLLSNEKGVKAGVKIGYDRSPFKIWSEYKELKDGKVVITVSLRSRDRFGKVWLYSNEFEDTLKRIDGIYKS